MNVSLEKKDALNAVLTIEIERGDYEPKYNETLKNFQKQGSFKGFRKGKTPLGYIRKIYGESALAEAVNETLQKTVAEYLTENEVNFLGQPLPAADQGPIDFDPKDLQTYEFVFDLGMAPEFELTGLDNDVRRFDVEVPSDLIDSEWEGYRKRLGTTVDVEDDIVEGDILFIQVTELEDGKDKEGGLTASFPVQVNDMADEKLQKEVMKMKQGDVFTFDPMTLEKDRDETFIRKYYFGLEDDDTTEFSNEFRAEIERVQRAVEAEVNQEFLDKLFGEGKITSEEQGRGEIEQGIKMDFDRQADAVLYKEMQQSLMDANPMDLPEEFLQRWLDTQREEGQPEPSDHDRADFLLDLKWQLIKDTIAKQNELKVENAEIEEGAYRRVYQYMGPYGDQQMAQRLASSILGNNDQVQRIAREIMANKVFEVLKESFKISDETITSDKFKEESERILQHHHH